MATNPGYEYQQAEVEYREADTPESKLQALQKMLRTAPKHKSSGNLLASIKDRIVKARGIIERQKKAKGSGYSFKIKKEGAAQICIAGKTNSGKSRLLNELTGANAEVADYEFTTQIPEVGIMDYHGLKIQVIEIPAVVKNFYGTVMGPTYLGILKQSDLIVLLFKTPDEKNFLDKELKDVATDVLIYNDENKKEFADKIWGKLGLVKVYTKQPRKKKDFPPMAFKKGSTVRDVANKVHKDFFKSFKYARIFGKSAKFEWQKVGLEHVLQDDDVVELHIK